MENVPVSTPSIFREPHRHAMAKFGVLLEICPGRDDVDILLADLAMAESLGRLWSQLLPAVGATELERKIAGGIRRCIERHSVK